MLTLLCCHQSHRFVSLAASKHLQLPHACSQCSQQWSASVRVWPAALSTPQRSGEPVKKSRLIGQRLPWEELGDASLIYYTHTSRGNQRKGILLTRRITSPHALLSLFPLLSPRSHMPYASTKTHTHTHTAAILAAQWGIIHPCLAPGSPVVLYCFCSFDFFHTRL